MWKIEDLNMLTISLCIYSTEETFLLDSFSNSEANASELLKESRRYVFSLVVVNNLERVKT